MDIREIERKVDILLEKREQKKITVVEKKGNIEEIFIPAQEIILPRKKIHLVNKILERIKF